jgi:hypothetical protein
MGSRREANRTMTRPQFLENLKLLFPELEDLPHHDTLSRLLARVDVEQIQEALVELLRTVLRRKKLRRFLVDGWLRVAVDGTQKLACEVCVNDHLHLSLRPRILQRAQTGEARLWLTLTLSGALNE